MIKYFLFIFAVCAACFSASAKAEIKLGAGGEFKAYLTVHDQDEDPALNVRSVDIIRHTEVEFSGETDLDNGLTVGFNAEAEADAGDSFEVDESHAYASGNLGRVNIGAEDGAAYLLQVAAPAADTNLDGIRQYINPVNYDAAPAAFTPLAGVPVDYAQDDTGTADKITYITPVFGGFQAAASYTFDTEDLGAGHASSFGNRLDDAADEFGSAWEVAARYEGEFNAVRTVIGAGYTRVNLEEEVLLDDQTAMNIGANLGIGPVSVGGVYTATSNLGGAADSKTIVAGADYTAGSVVLGASYFTNEIEDFAGTDDLETDRYSGGVTYTYGPSMSFRGSAHHIEHDLGADSMDATSFLLGTEVGF